MAQKQTFDPKIREYLDTRKPGLYYISGFKRGSENSLGYPEILIDGKVFGLSLSDAVDGFIQEHKTRLKELGIEDILFQPWLIRAA